MKNIRENTLINWLKSLVKTQWFCKFTVTTDNTVNYDFTQSFFIYYIYAAAGYTHRVQCSSLLTACGISFSPLPKSND